MVQFLRRIFHLRRRGRNRNDSFAFETWIHSQQFPETCEQEPRSDQQHTRETNLRHHKPSPHCTRTCPAGTCARFLSQNRKQFDLGEVSNRHKTDQDASYNGYSERK